MMALAFLNAPLRCQVCDAVVNDQAWFTWGFCRSRSPVPESSYRVGEAIRWHTCPDRTTPQWTQFSSPASDDRGANIGSPDVTDLLVRDLEQRWLFDPCPSCGAALDGAVVEIGDGRIVGGRLLVPGELPPEEYLLPTPSGWSMPDGWGEHPLDWREDC